MRLRVGCAMWSLKSWQGRFQPHPATPGDRLRAYASWCNAVEGNTTFYAIPTRETVESWAAHAPDDFGFVLKIPKIVTHERRLIDADEPLAAFFDAIEPLKDRTQALWIQLPGAFGPQDLHDLYRFLRRMPAGHRWAVEVRHPEFFADPRRLEEMLTAVDAEWVPFDTTTFFASPPTSDAERDAWTKKPRMPLREHATTARPIVRYLGRDDSDRTIEGWQKWVRTTAEWLREGRAPTVFVHTPDNADAPELCRRFHDEVRALVPELEPLPDPLPLPEPEAPLTLF
ncbi:uncharacterized protein YecE (DUF72 family) [Actinoplanes lutulentus]|uniref:Uncharacterized protein YecE (DUF72 family) n=2 Tax=Actinoplanes lutulentus TaxID=1287878 RepID=A0A327ZAQ7_9ACTN|nr:uncharacterized protein YecE (DUF72 family) [Actinoplanes lutulentus]RAK35683.1 uncharacterized protein YecE (DUF72 family) [Actinoplanes lutulentus]